MDFYSWQGMQQVLVHLHELKSMEWMNHNKKNAFFSQQKIEDRTSPLPKNSNPLHSLTYSVWQNPCNKLTMLQIEGQYVEVDHLRNLN